MIEQAKRSLERLHSALRPAYSTATQIPDTTKETLQKQIHATRQGFLVSMDDDFNTAGALGYLFDLVRAINQTRDAGTEQTILNPAQDLLRELSGVLGLRLETPEKENGDIPPLIELLVEVRQILREQHLWSLSDKIRDRLAELGIVLEDGKEGTTWRRKK